MATSAEQSSPMDVLSSLGYVMSLGGRRGIWQLPKEQWATQAVASHWPCRHLEAPGRSFQSSQGKEQQEPCQDQL